VAGRSFEILEAGSVIGQAWRNHCDRLHLNTPKSASALPGLAMPTTGRAMPPIGGASDR
jgi:cation diffusion facilitator CzcD-associated flavoprotein CzcO